MEVQEIKELIQKTLEKQRYGVYNTVRNEQPHSALVGFATTPDLSKIIILTPKNTRKYINTQLNQKVNLFVSTTTNDPKDLDTALTISVLGTAEVSDKLSVDIIKEYKSIFLQKNSHMKSLAEKIDDIIVISVDTFEVTKNYQKSVVQTKTDMTKLYIRQTPGIPVVQGYARGSAFILTHFSNLSEEHKNSIIVVTTIEESEVFPSVEIKGLIVGNNKIPENILKVLREQKIPSVKGLGLEIENIKSGDQISINGSLGLLIFHEIKF